MNATTGPHNDHDCKYSAVSLYTCNMFWIHRYGLCLVNRVIKGHFHKGLVYKKTIISWSFSYNSFVKFKANGEKIW